MRYVNYISIGLLKLCAVLFSRIASTGSWKFFPISGMLGNSWVRLIAANCVVD